MWPDRRLVDLFKLEHPLVLAPMAGFGTVELAAAVCDAGGLGSIACAAMQPQIALVPFTSDEGLARLARAEGKIDFPAWRINLSRNRTSPSAVPPLQPLC